MMTARAALRRGWHELWRAPSPTFLALVGALAAALAARAAWLRAGEALVAGRPGRALVTLLVGTSLAALFADATRAVALTAYAGPPRPFARTVALGLWCTPGFISVRAVELLVYFTLALGELFVLGRALPRLGADPTRLALAGVACLAPAIAIATVVWAASRVAQTLIARGLRPATAVVHGYDVALRRFASLARLGILGAVVAAPFAFVALLVPAPLGGIVMGFVALWMYAALATVVGRDARLAIG